MNNILLFTCLFLFIGFSCENANPKKDCYECYLAGKIIYSGCEEDVVYDTIYLGEYCGDAYDQLIDQEEQMKVDQSACVIATTITKPFCR